LLLLLAGEQVLKEQWTRAGLDGDRQWRWRQISGDGTWEFLPGQRPSSPLGYLNVTKADDVERDLMVLHAVSIRLCLIPAAHEIGAVT